MSGPVRSVSQAFAILRLLAGQPHGLSLSAIARELELSPSSCLNLLRTLVAEDMVERGEVDRLYRARAGWDRLDFARGAAERLIARAEPLMRSFAKAHEATVGLWQAVSADRLALVALAESSAATRIHLVIGQRQPIGGGATGRALAACEGLGPDELHRRFEALRSQRPLDFGDYAAQVELARRQGYALDAGYGHAGVWSLGCAIGGTGNARFCLSVSVFANSRDAAALDELGKALTALAGEITAANAVR